MTDAQAQSQEEQSMEEILESIRRIIAEDEEGNPIEAENAETSSEPAPAVESAVTEDVSEEVSLDDVLELTEIIEETPEEVEPEAPQEEESAMESSPSPAEDTSDVLDNIDTAIAPEEPQSDFAVDEALISGETAKAASDKLKELKSNISKPVPTTSPSPVTRNGTTVEDLMMEAMRPMLKEWLDSNLPSIVERIVEREVRKITE